MGWGECGFNCWRVRRLALELFSFYVNVSGMRPRSRLFSQHLMVPAPWVLLCVGWPISLVKWFHPGWLPPVFFLGIGKQFLFTHTFPSFPVFPLSWPSSNIVPLSAACWGYSLIIFIHYMLGILLNNIYLLYCHLLPSPRGRHASWQEKSYSEREEKHKNFPFMPFKL